MLDEKVNEWEPFMLLLQFYAQYLMLLSGEAAQEIIWSIILHTINHSKHKLSPCTKYGKIIIKLYQDTF